MLERLFHLFQSPPKASAPLPKPDAQLALGTLLVRVAMADKAYLFEEVEQIDRVLAHAFGLKPLDAAKLRGTCETLNARLPSDINLAEVVHANVDYAHRIEAVSCLWAVARADGTADDREEALIEVIESHLGVDRTDSEAARTATVLP